MLSRSELGERVSACRPEVVPKFDSKLAVNAEGHFFCRECRAYFRQRVREVYSGRPKKCRCKKGSVAPWVPADQGPMQETAEQCYKEGLTVVAISNILGVSTTKVYDILRGADSCYDQRLRQDSGSEDANPAGRS